MMPLHVSAFSVCAYPSTNLEPQQRHKRHLCMIDGGQHMAMSTGLSKLNFQVKETTSEPMLSTTIFDKWLARVRLLVVSILETNLF